VLLLGDRNAKLRIETSFTSAQKTTGWIAIKAYDDDPCRSLVVGVYTVQRIRDCYDLGEIWVNFMLLDS